MYCTTVNALGSEPSQDVRAVKPTVQRAKYSMQASPIELTLNHQGASPEHHKIQRDQRPEDCPQPDTPSPPPPGIRQGHLLSLPDRLLRRPIRLSLCMKIIA